MKNLKQFEYKEGQRFGFTQLSNFTFRLTKKVGEFRFLTMDSDGVDGAISTGELNRAIIENKIYLKDATITTDNT